MILHKQLREGSAFVAYQPDLREKQSPLQHPSACPLISPCCVARSVEVPIEIDAMAVVRLPNVAPSKH